jgi:hypothetical protein
MNPGGEPGRETPFHTIWGMDKTRVALHSNRISHMLNSHPNTSMMSMNYFNDRLNRFHMNWRS